MEETKIEQINEELSSSVPQNVDDTDEAEVLEKGKALALRIAEILDDRKAKDIKIINVNKKTVIADYFVIAGGSSRTQVNALADEVEYKLGLEGIDPTRVEGRGDGSWVLLDFDSVLVHVFGRESRDFYKLEKLWAEGTPVEYTQKED
ncbi:MAG: ribosome silencing factor [Clostridia bacterium]|nr:ribosome silencing factor [Clostridia bacterium]